jgi:hypothetical protein
MKRALAAACGATLLIISAHRLPAPISEEKTSPPEAPSKPAKHKASDSADSSSIRLRRLDGTWRATASSKNQAGTFNHTFTVIIRNGTADLTVESTSTLAPGKKWSDLPAPYNSISPIYRKSVDKSTELKAEGSNTRIRWPGGRIIDWAPKTIPVGLFKSSFVQPASTLYILSGQQLIVTNGKASLTYTRVR